MSDRLPDGVRELLVNRIDSFEKLELVVTLHAAPRSTMSIADLCRVLKRPRDAIRQSAIELRAVSLVELTSRGEVHLLPPTTRDNAAINALVQLCRDDRVAIARVLGDLALDRIRNLASRRFADAVVLKKPPKNGDG